MISEKVPELDDDRTNRAAQFPLCATWQSSAMLPSVLPDQPVGDIPGRPCAFSFAWRWRARCVLRQLSSFISIYIKTD
jgi:hypothetical protein